MAGEREAIEANCELTLQGMTIAAGYNLPKDLGLVTRQILDYDETAGKRPACIIQFPSQRREPFELGGIYLYTLAGRLVFYFDVETNGMLPATWANRYIEAGGAALEKDRSRGGQPAVLTTQMTYEPTALIWKTGQAMEATLDFEVLWIGSGTN